MPIPASVARVVMSGGLPNGEIWSSGFWLSFVEVDSQAAATAFAQAVYEQLAEQPGGDAVFVMQNYLWGPNTYLDTVTVYFYTNEGPTADLIGVSGGHHLAGSATGHMPNQVSLVLSLRSGFPGRRNRGRMYMPASGSVSATADNQMLQASMDYIIDGWKLSLQGMVTEGIGVPAIVSTVGTTAVPIKQLVLDSKYDIQRRRANDEAALRVSNRTLP